MDRDGPVVRRLLPDPLPAAVACGAERDINRAEDGFLGGFMLR